MNARKKFNLKFIAICFILTSALLPQAAFASNKKITVDGVIKLNNSKSDVKTNDKNTRKTIKAEYTMKKTK